MMNIKTVADLKESLEGFDDDSPVALAIGEGWPFEYTIARVEQADDGKVYLAEGRQMDYLSHEAREAIGW